MIVPSIDLMNGSAVQLEGGDADKLRVDGGDPRPIATRFARAGEIAVIDLDAALGKGDNTTTIEGLLKLAPCRVGGGIRDVDRAIRWLDAGARQVILGTAATPEVLRELPRERVSAALDARHGDVVVKGWTEATGRTVIERMRELHEFAGHFLVTFVEREGKMGGIDLAEVEKLAHEAGDCKLTVAGGVTTIDELQAIDAMGVDAQVGMALYTGAMGLGEAAAAPIRGAKEAITTVVCDAHGVALGLATSTTETIARSVDEGRAVFASGPGGEIGEAIGRAELIALAYDEARVSARCIVRLDAMSAGSSSQSAWGNTGTLGSLETTIRNRMQAAPEGSYTKRLFSEKGLLGAKLIEEAHELIDASDAGDAQESAWETADVIYFALTAMVRAGATLEDVERELTRRAGKVTRRKGDAKQRFVRDDLGATGGEGVGGPSESRATKKESA